MSKLKLIDGIAVEVGSGNGYEDLGLRALSA
jgi:hypothetical protein